MTSMWIYTGFVTQDRHHQTSKSMAAHKRTSEILEKISHFPPFKSLQLKLKAFLRFYLACARLSVCELLSVCYRWIRRLVLSSLDLVTCANCSSRVCWQRNFFLLLNNFILLPSSQYLTLECFH